MVGYRDSKGDGEGDGDEGGEVEISMFSLEKRYDFFL
jgi:hypothetical protein